MTKPVNLWEPSTDKYKAQAIQAEDIEAEHREKLRDLHASKLRKPWKQDDAPLGVRMFTWYYFMRSGIWALLLLVVVVFPRSAPSALVTGSFVSFLPMPGRRSQREERRTEIVKAVRKYGVPEVSGLDAEQKLNPEDLRNFVIAYLLFRLAAAAVIGFMWWNRSWKVRWVTLFYAGALIGKALLGFIAGTISGAGSGLAPDQISMLLGAIGINGIIFLYLLFAYDVKQWFQEES